MPLQEIGPNDHSKLQNIADIIAKSHKILIISGAGISTSCGIPDFRSKDGLYNIIPEQQLPPTPPPSNPSTPSRKRKRSETPLEDLQSSQSSTYSSASGRSSSNPAKKIKGQDLFSSNIFSRAESTSVFYRFISALRQKIHNEIIDSSLTHKFIRTLRDGGRLVRCYTQNIDGLEGREGLCMDLTRGMGNKRRFMKKYYEACRPDFTQGTDFDTGCEVIQLHGDLDRLRCNVCSTQYEWTEDETVIFEEGAAPSCPKCEIKSEKRQSTGKRGLSIGVLRPNVVLYGEDHPFNSLLTPFIPFDASLQPEVLIIMGTSLKVFGLQKIIREFSKAVHSCKGGKGRVIFVNRTRPAESVWDGIIDDFVAIDCDSWVEDLRLRRSDIWLRQGDVNLKLTKPGLKRKQQSDAIDGQPKRKYTKKPKTSTDIQTENTLMPIGKTLQPINPNIACTTPLQYQKSTIWKNNIPNHTPAGKTFGPPPQPITRPNPSPLTNSFKPLLMDSSENAILPGSPWTPEFSPITPKIFQYHNNGFGQGMNRIYIEDENENEEEEETSHDDMVQPQTPCTIKYSQRGMRGGVVGI